MVTEMNSKDFSNVYRDQVIYIESSGSRAHWLHAHSGKHSKPSGEVHLVETPHSEVINDVDKKWVVKKKLKEDSTAVIESVQFRNHYLGAHTTNDHKHVTHVRYSAYPYDEEWALWYLEDKGDGNACFVPKRYDNSDSEQKYRIDSTSTHARLKKGIDDWSIFKIYQPTVEDRKELLFSYDNTKSGTPVKTEYTEQTGISTTHTTTESITVTTQMGVEIESVFNAKASFSDTWKTSTSQTWSSQVTKKVSIEIPPGTILKISQLTGYYGEGRNKYRVASNHLFFEDK